MRRDSAGRVRSSVVAVLSVVALAAALVAFVIDGSGRDDKPAAADQPRTVQSTETTPTPAVDKKAKPKNKRKSKSSPQPEVVPDVYVEVYNMTSVSGLASAKAAQLQDAGWQVVGIDNWRGNIPASTVYYPGGMEDAAAQLAKTLGIGRTHGAVAPMKFDRLTVILTADAT